MKVMIVEDELLFRESLKRKLLGFPDVNVVAEMENGIEAEMMLEQVNPDLILCDIRMPGMDGITFLEQIHKDHGKNQIVVFISGFSDFEYARKALRWGAFDYLTKPLDADELSACLWRVREQLRSQAEQALEVPEKANAPVNPSAIELCTQWIDKHLKDASLESVAEYAQMHPSAFSRKFRADTGQTFIRFITEKRMERARELLMNPLLKVQQIGQQVGYVDHRHFTEMFKRHVGCTPTEFREGKS